MSTAVTEVVSIGTAVATANRGVAESTTAVLAAAEDEVSTAIAALFSAHGQGYQALTAQAAAFHERFVQALASATRAYTAAEAANASPLAALEQTVLGVDRQLHQVSNIFAAETSALASQAWSGLESLTALPNNPLLRLISSDIPPLSWLVGNSPPPLLNLLLGETVQYTTYEGMRVVQITPAHPTGEYVVALHGGALIFPPSFFHWINYSVTAYQTGATIQVPIYPLVQEGGTAGTVVPTIARFISSQIAQYGSTNVSVTGDSAGGNLALAALQYMRQTDPLGPMPYSAVLLSPWLDVGTRGIGTVWAGNLGVTNYMASPLYGSLDGLPPTYVYSGSLDPLAAQAAILQQAAIAAGAPFGFELFPGGIHDWILLTPWGLPYWPQINQQLGITA
ncbi:lipase [Mycobacterium intermedium]|nr:PE domain-containing protein [Mycobacterium intermedium]ODQ99726.1 lipase [Mycobacterium intermedium]